MDSHSSSNSETRSQAPAGVSSLCRAGCGFYANSLFDGMCSKCYKDMSKTSVASILPSATPTGSQMSAASSGDNCVPVSVTMNTSVKISNSVNNTVQVSLVDTALPTVPSASSLKSEGDQSSDAEVSEVVNNQTATTCGQGKLKKNRCFLCKKKVGLTGFDCRCGGHFCSTHRYSDAHNCSFNYRELAQSEIRKHNPVVSAEKVQKL